MKQVCLVIIFFALIGVAYIMFQYVQADEKVMQCHYQIGKFKLYSLLDGHINFQVKNIRKDDSAFDDPLFHPKQNQTMQVPINIFLLDFDDQKLLVDVGLAGMFAMPTGQLLQALTAAGYQSDQITGILITHFHFDHIAGLLHQDGTKAFAHAKLYVSQAEVNYWMSEQAAQEHAQTVEFMQKVFALYSIHIFGDNEQLFDGISVFSSVGHTDGHTGFLCNSDDKQILIWGDILHIPQLQFAHPKVSILDDSNHEQAITTRLKIMQQAVQNGWIIAGVHLQIPGVGMILESQDTTDQNPSYIWKSLDPIC